jgi:acyl-CoA thioesterase-1
MGNVAMYGVRNPGDGMASESQVGMAGGSRMRSRSGLLVLAIASVACSSRELTTTPSDPVVRRVVVLGDSLAVSPSPGDSFPARLQTRIARDGLRYTVTNASANGETTDGGMRRLTAALDTDVAVVVVELGVNDGLRGVAAATIERNLSMIVETALRDGRRVLLCGMEVPPIHGFDYSIEFHRIFQRLAQRYSVPLVPFLLAGVVFNPDLNGPDGVHPNAAGAERIAETVWPFLKQLLQPQ